jgi:hypothetical protein
MVSNYCGNVSNTNGTVDPTVLAAHCAEVVALYSTVVAALERRRAAGTLLEGKCTAAEEAYEGAYLREANCPPAEAASLAKLVGYGTFLFAARHVPDVLRNAFFFAGECSAAQFATFTQFVVNAADLMQLPRSHGPSDYCADVCFAETRFEAMPLLLSDYRGLPSRTGFLSLAAVDGLSAAPAAKRRAGGARHPQRTSASHREHVSSEERGCHELCNVGAWPAQLRAGGLRRARGASASL